MDFTEFFYYSGLALWILGEVVLLLVGISMLLHVITRRRG